MRLSSDPINTAEHCFDPEVGIEDEDRRQMIMERKRTNIGVGQASRRGPARCGHIDSLGLMRSRDKCHSG